MRRLALCTVALFVVAAACGDDDAATTTTAATTTVAPTTTTVATTTTTSTTAAPTTTATPTTTTTIALGPVVSIVEGTLGAILTDPDGMTLYLFLPDDQGASQCNGGCANTWPPLLAEVGAGPGVDADLLGTVARSDGTLQVTYNGWPLYRYAPDDAPGDVTGQGAGGNWWVVDAAGEPIM